MCTLTNTTYGEVTWTPCCNVCGSEEASAISKLCKSCWNKDFYQRNKVTILQKAKEKVATPEAKEKRAEYMRKWNNKPGQKEKTAERLLTQRRKPGTRFAQSKWRANSAKVAWTLTKQTYFALLQMECWYCNGFFQKQSEMTGVGLDRIDNSKGYEPGNVISCCGACNLTRQSRWTCEQAKVMIEAVIQYNKVNHIPAPSGTIED